MKQCQQKGGARNCAAELCATPDFRNERLSLCRFRISSNADMGKVPPLLTVMRLVMASDTVDILA